MSSRGLISTSCDSPGQNIGFIGQPWVNVVTMYTHMREVIRET
jgi:hypothetical protein